MNELVNLIDILKKKYSLKEANTGVELSQSSFSKWSKTDEPHTLIRDNEFEFANHTGLESSPWVQISYKEEISPYFIILENRDNEKYIDLASELIVQISIDGEIYKDIHKGLCYFGALPNAYPLVLPLLGKEKLRHIKISINSDTLTYLHLRRITVLQSQKISKETGLFFLASRSDGLGERLKAILNTIFLSEKLGISYRIAWPLRGGMNVNQYHDITEAELVFDEKYVNQFFIEEKELENKKIIDLGRKGPICRKDIPELIDSEHDYIKVQQSDVSKYISDVKRGSEDYREFFKKIKFSKNIQEVIDYVNSMDYDKNTIAIHMRGGDIVYGEYRKGQLYYQKLIPLATCIHLHNKLISEQKNVIVFFQDKSLKKYLKKFGMCVSDDYIIKSWSQLQKTFFEMFLMSKCSEIICGTSGFASVASRISGTKLRNANFYLDEDEIVASLISRMSDTNMDNYQRAFTINNYLVKTEKKLDVNDTLNYLMKASILDPDNELYKVKLIYARVSAKQLEQAESDITALFTKYYESSNNDSHFETIFVKPFYLDDLQYYTRKFKDLDLTRFKNLQRIKNLIFNFINK